MVITAGAPTVPETAHEEDRAQPGAHITLATDRVLRKKTRDHRSLLPDQFGTWLLEESGLVLAELLEKKLPDAEEICNLLVQHRKQLHFSGKTYNRYAETINAITMVRPLLLHG